VVIYFEMVKLVGARDSSVETSFEFANPSFGKILQVNSFKTKLTHNFM
jgi:hypothetical protein